MKRKRKQKKGKYSDHNISSLEQHERRGKKLLPPFTRVGQMELHSWLNECVPNVLWACILSATLDRGELIPLLRRCVIRARELADIELEDESEFYLLVHNHMESFSNKVFDFIFAPVLELKSCTEALSSLVLIQSLPDFHHWQRHLDAKDAKGGWQALARAVTVCMDHQSQQSTDVRWMKLMNSAIFGRVRFSETQAKLVEELRLYPDKGDQRAVRPTIRAMEMMVRLDEFGEHKPTKIKAARQNEFWEEAFKKTHCLPSPRKTTRDDERQGLVSEILGVSEKLSHHFMQTIRTTAVDARHDGAFGLVFYALCLAMNAANRHNQILTSGLLLLRSLVEVVITLRYLAKHDSEMLWMQYRNYGDGQAKLAFLKIISDEKAPAYMDIDALHALANEDKWMEFLPIDVGVWSNKDLRKMSIESGSKTLYDRYYTWPSGFVHAHWAAVRDSVFTTCFNPLHRLHRVPSPPRLMSSVMPDVVKLSNIALKELNQLYPTFKSKVRLNPVVKATKRKSKPS